jgi:CBS domain containing-hemolysin-like protein
MWTECLLFEVGMGLWLLGLMLVNRNPNVFIDWIALTLRLFGLILVSIILIEFLEHPEKCGWIVGVGIVMGLMINIFILKHEVEIGHKLVDWLNRLGIKANEKVFVTPLIIERLNQWTVQMTNRIPHPYTIKDKVCLAEWLTSLNLLERQGVFSLTHTLIVQRIVDLMNFRLYHIMLSRLKLVKIERNSDLTEVRQQANTRESPVLWVYEKNIENLVGYIKKEDLYETHCIEDILRSPQYLSEHMRVIDVIKKIKRKEELDHFVVDEYGNVEGYIDVERVHHWIFLESVEIGKGENLIYGLSKSHFIVDGRTKIVDIERHLGWERVTEDVETISGKLLELSEHHPVRNKSYFWRNSELVITRLSGSRIIEIEMKLED